MIRRLGRIGPLFRCCTILALLPFFAGCVTVAEKERLETLAMYGQPTLERPGFLQRQDQSFVQQQLQRYRGDRRSASNAWIERGVRNLQLGAVDESMRYFNRAWLLDKGNYRVYWGFAQAQVAHKAYIEARGSLEKALALLDVPFQRPALLTDMAIVYSLLGEAASAASADRRHYFELANDYFERAVQSDAGYLPVWERWAQSLFREGRFTLAWNKLIQAQSHGVTRFSREFIDRLSVRRPAPSGFSQ